MFYNVGVLMTKRNISTKGTTRHNERQPEGMLSLRLSCSINLCVVGLRLPHYATSILRVTFFSSFTMRGRSI